NNECIRMNGSGATVATLTARSVVLQCNTTKYIGTGTISAAQVATAFGTGANGNNDAFTPSLVNVFVNGANETAVVATNPNTLEPTFTATTWIGAVKDATDTWYAGWTCNSGTLAFDSTSVAGRSCLSLPVPTV
ncbi:MAG: hypothetical protein ABW048_12210, partial [Sphingobium sp.]